MEIDAVEHSWPPLVAEADILEDDFAAHRVELDRLRAIFDLVGHVDNLKGTAGAAGGTCGEVDEKTEPLHWAVEHGDVEDHRRQRADGDLAGERTWAAKPEQKKDADRQQKSEEGPVVGPDLDERRSGARTTIRSRGRTSRARGARGRRP
jgi:hypothetical protein